MKTKQLRFFPAIAMLLLAILACNMPSTARTAEPVISGNNPLPDPGQPSVVTASGLPTVTMPAGTGYIFPTGEITSGNDADRDVWWNAAQFVPATAMGSLGQVNNLAAVTGIELSSLAFGAYAPAVGEAFAVQVDRGGLVTYALIRVESIADDMSVTFEWVYPFAGQIQP